MKDKFEGLVLSKRPLKSRDLLVQFLTRQGEKRTVLFYGGVKSKKNTAVLELGHLVECELKGGARSLPQAVGWHLRWHHRHIRDHYQHFYLMCFFLEFIEKLAPSFEESEATSGEENAGNFRVLSNALFYLDRLEEGVAPYQQLKLLFLIKLIHELGIWPQWERCHFCEGVLSPERPSTLLPSEGAFSCLPCSSEDQGLGDQLQNIFALARQLKFSDYTQLEGVKDFHFHKLMHYFSFHLQFDLGLFKTLNLL